MKQSQIGLFFPVVVFLFLLFFCVFIFFRFRFKGNREKQFDHGSQNRVVESRFERFLVFFDIDRFLSLKNRDDERFTVFPVGPYGPVRVSKPCILVLVLKDFM